MASACSHVPAHAVELMAAVLAHPLGAAAPAAGTPASRALLEQGGGELPLGEVPHMIRGQLGGFSQARWDVRGCVGGRYVLVAGGAVQGRGLFAGELGIHSCLVAAGCFALGCGVHARQREM